MSAIIARLKREPIVSRVGLAAILNVLVVSGVIDPPQGVAVETAVLAVVNAVAILTARQRTVPEAEVILAARQPRSL